MTKAHIFPRVFVGTSESHGKKGLLLDHLPFHVGIVEEPRDALIGEHLSVKRFH
jgi:hypothetical protein